MVTTKNRLPDFYWLMPRTMGKPRGRSPNSSLVIGVPATNTISVDNRFALRGSPTGERLERFPPPLAISVPEDGWGYSNADLTTLSGLQKDN